MLVRRHLTPGRSVAHVGRNALEAAPGHCLFASIGQSDPPRFGEFMMELHLVAAYAVRHSRLVQKVVREILLDHGALVPKADDEFVDAMMGVRLPDVSGDQCSSATSCNRKPSSILMPVSTTAHRGGMCVTTH